MPLHNFLVYLKVFLQLLTLGITINNNYWVFYSNSKTKFYANTENLIYELNILKKFENTIYPKKYFADYNYIDLRIENQIIVKEKYHKS